MSLLSWFSESTRGLRRAFHLIPSQEPDLERANTTLMLAAQGQSSINLQPAPASINEIIKHITSLLLAPQNRTRIAAAAVLSCLGIGVNFLSPYLFGKITQTLSNPEEESPFAGAEAAMIVALIGGYYVAQLVPNVREQILAPVTTRTNEIVLNQARRFLFEQSLQYHVNKPIGDRIICVQRSISFSFVSSLLANKILPSSVEVIAACTVLSNLYGWEIGLSVLSLLISFTFYGVLSTQSIIRTRERHLDSSNAMWTAFFDGLRRFPLMQICCQRDFDMNKISAVLAQLAEAETHSTTLPLKNEIAHISMARLAMLFATLFLGLNIPARYSTQQFTILAIYLNQLCLSLPGFGKALGELFSYLPDMKFVLNAMKETHTILDLYPDVPLRVSPDGASIEFKNITLAYKPKPGMPPKAPVLTHFSLIIPKGKMVALVSPSGTGKSTLFKLLYRLYDLDSGSILIDNQDIAQVSIDSLRAQIAYFAQSPHLFQGTIRDNIRYGAANPEQVTDEIIWEKARALNLEPFLREITLEKEVGENGSALSGGEQQRIAILRNLFKEEASIILFDEITSALDSNTGKLVLEGLKTVCAGKTSIMITHKLSELEHTVDEIIVLNQQGELVAQGPHEELLLHCTLYQKLWRASHASENKVQSPGNLSVFAHKEVGTTVAETPEFPPLRYDA